MTFWKDFLKYKKGRGKNVNELSRDYINTIKIMTWNVLAPKATKYQSVEHKYHPQSVKGLSEHIEQTIRRYELIFQEIVKKDMDIICLQEVDSNLFAYMKKHLKDEYQIIFYPVFDNNSNNQSFSFGTAVLFKIKRFQIKKKNEINSKTNKYQWKNSTIVLLKDKKTDKLFYVVSIHLSGSNPEKNIELIGDTIKKMKKDIPFIIAGDFNCRYLLSDCLSKYEKFSELKTFKFKKNDISTCSFDYDAKYKESLIDGVFFSKNFNGINYKIGKYSCEKKLYKETKNNSYSDVVFGSDHFWIKGLLELN